MSEFRVQQEIQLWDQLRCVISDLKGGGLVGFFVDLVEKARLSLILVG